ncbi:Hypothetical predicted protein, partial [Paramuricea clavata]
MATMKKKKAVAAFVLLQEFLELDEIQKKKRSRKVWVRPWIARRQQRGCFHQLVPELELEDETSYFNYFRMDKKHFGILSDLVESRIRKCDTAMRASIKPEERLAVTLRYLATGESFKSLEFQFRISRTAISVIVVETCHAIFNVLSKEFLKLPSTPEGWLHLSSIFEKRWNFPNGIGAVDGKRITIQQPGMSGSHYYDYKGHNSLILLAAVGPQYEILWADVGANGRVSDGTVWQKCALKQALAAENNPLNLPQPRLLPELSTK